MATRIDELPILFFAWAADEELILDSERSD